MRKKLLRVSNDAEFDFIFSAIKAGFRWKEKEEKLSVSNLYVMEI